MGAYDPEVPAKRPGGKPINAPKYRILVHRKYEAAWNQIVERVGFAASPTILGSCRIFARQQRPYS